ncbi:transcriptional regulator [Bacillus sp. FJAT-27225]|uniref:CdaR family transcriptional regulator n=1 Tax=Bacillus sp. FJAT-27225 TaxID=1743144 RepID=UPI00080C25BF|nr:sugar diacid recognition domain-containing protein [Bacillus sp. FJAT-27225]OCA81639.1 transcriptional regulator [Bacillus sp. FJAT-27225]
MKILEYIAQDIVERTSAILEFPISITDNQGIIIGSTDKSRIGIFHQPSLEVIKKNEMIECKNEIEKQILPGVSAPLKFNHKIIGVLGIVGEPREVEKYVQLVKNQVEMMCQEAFRKEMIELKGKMIEMFVHQLIHYREEESEVSEQLLQSAKLLEFNMEKSRICLLIDIKNLSEEISLRKTSDEYYGSFPLQFFQQEVLSFLRIIFHEQKDDMISFLSLERIIVIKSLPFPGSYSALLESLDEKLVKISRFLESKYKAAACISIGDVHTGLGGVAQSYQNAIHAMSIGTQLNRESAVHLFNERETLIRMLPKELSQDYQTKLLNFISPLIRQDNYEILASTFLGFCKYNMNLSEASRNMYIHRNTIIYRLERISEITSLQTNNFEQCMLLYSAIHCYEEQRNKFTLPIEKQSLL